MARTRGLPRLHLVGLAAATLYFAAVVVPSSLTWAAPSRQDLAQAKARLQDLNRQQGLLVEQYDQAKVNLDLAQRRLAILWLIAGKQQAQADAAHEALTARVVQTFMNGGSSLEILLGAESFADFTDRLAFVSDLVGQDAAVASQAEKLRAAALQTVDELRTTIAIRQQLLTELAQKKAEIESSIAEQRALVVQIAGSVAKAEAQAKLEAQRQAKLRATSTSTNPSASISSPSPSPTSSGNLASPSPTPAPSPSQTSGGGSSGPSTAAMIAVRAAYSVLGVPYVWGGDSPSTGFDCSGLTMWAWEQAGVYLPHSSAMQYEVIPHVSRWQLLPGDLVFFFSPISHVAMYVGNDMMIEAPHVGGVVQLTQFSTYPDFAGAGRPG